jgi:hypothetical protein
MSEAQTATSQLKISWSGTRDTYSDWKKVVHILSPWYSRGLAVGRPVEAPVLVAETGDFECGRFSSAQSPPPGFGSDRLSAEHLREEVVG